MEEFRGELQVGVVAVLSPQGDEKMRFFEKIRGRLSVAAVCSLALLPLQAHASSAGIGGYSGKQANVTCASSGCHGLNDATVTISDPVALANPTQLYPGESRTLAISAARALNSGVQGVGIDIAVSDGTLSIAPTETTTTKMGGFQNAEILQSGAPLKTATGGATVSYDFVYTMPANALPADAARTIYGAAQINRPGGGGNTSRSVTVILPAQPASLAAVPQSNTSIAVNWSGTTPSYKVLYKTGAFPTSATDATATVLYTGPNTSATATNLLPSTTYYFSVYGKGGVVFSSTARTAQAVTNASVPQTYYVDAANGSNANAGALSTPFKTISAAMTVAAAGDSIKVAKGTYNVALGETFPIVLKSGVVLQSDFGAASTIIDATGAGKRVIEGQANNAATVLDGFTIKGALFIDGPGYQTWGGGIFLSDNSHTTIRNNIISGNEARGQTGYSAFGGGIYVTSGNPVIVNNVFRNNIARGGTGSDSPSSLGGSGAYAAGGGLYISSASAQVSNNTFYGNSAIGGNGGSAPNGTGGSGGEADAGGAYFSGATVRNNILSNNSAIGGAGGDGLNDGDDGPASNGGASSFGTQTNSLFFQNTPDDGTTGEDAIAGQNPFFVNAANGDFHIQLASPARGAGTSTVETDLEGYTRNNPPSIGAYEGTAVAPIVLNATLSGAQQVPQVESAASGTATAIINGPRTLINVSVSSNGLTGISGGHIHFGAVGANGGIIFEFAPGGKGSFSRTLSAANLSPQAGASTFSEALTALQNSNTYVNLHTAAFPGGEIRGQLFPTGTSYVLNLGIAPLTFSESAGVNAATGTVTRNVSTGSSTVVTLSNNNPAAVSIPATVTIPSGATQATFAIQALNDQVFTGNRSVIIGARVSGFTSSKTVTVTEDEPEDQSPPNVAVTSPAHNSVIKTVSSITGTAADNAGGTGLDSVKAYLRRFKAGSTTTYEYWAKRSGVWSWGDSNTGFDTTLGAGNTWSVSNASPAGTELPAGANFLTGSYQFYAQAFDNGGNGKTSGINKVTVDTSAPSSIAVTTPAHNSTIKGLPSIKGTAADTSGGSGIGKVVVYLRRFKAGSTTTYEYWAKRSGVWGWGDSNAGFATVFSAGEWTVSASGPAGTELPSGADLPTGSYQFYAYAYDKAANYKISTINKVTVDNVAPSSVVITSPTDDSTLSVLTVIKGTAADASGGSGIKHVDAYLRRGPSGSYEYWAKRSGVWGWGASVTPIETTFSAGDWRVDNTAPTGTQLPAGSTNLPPGAYQVFAKAYDKAENAKLSAIHSFTVIAGGSEAPAAESASIVVLSSASAQSSSGTVRLVFSGAVEINAASDPSRYSVSIDGVAVAIESVQVTSSTTVVLTLEEGSVKAGDVLDVDYGIKDSKGRTIKGQAKVTVK